MRGIAPILIALAIAGCSKKTETGTSASASASEVTPPKPSVQNACPDSVEGELPKCNNTLVTKVDKYTWKVTTKGKWDVTLAQPDSAHGFRPVLLVWKDPDATIAQDDVATFGTGAHVSVDLEPGTYHVSVINGSRGGEVQQPFPYSLTISRAK